MEFLRSLYFTFDEDAKIAIFTGLRFYVIAVLGVCVLLHIASKILISSQETRGKMTAFIFGVILANIVAIFCVIHLLQEIGILQ